MATILIVDDEKNIRLAVQRLFDLDGHRTILAADGDEALRQLQREDVDLVVLDLQMPGKDGFAVLEALRPSGADAAVPVETPVIVLTGHGSIAAAVRAVKAGAHDFLEKPPDPERLMLSARNALRLARLGAENRELRGALQARRGLVGDGALMRALRAEIARAAAAPNPVLITGENGTGKEMVATAIHEASSRRAGPFVAVNCAALPAELFESELFGSEPGAFTGATRRRAGRFERAAGGTLFLDEIGEIPPTLQAKLLRALDTMTIERLGGDQPIRVDARLVAATNRDLRAAMAAGVFRQDLFYRLAVLPIAVPPLRERREDIQALAETFLAEARRQRSTPAARLAPAAVDALAAYDYPGNVRELRNLIERLALLATAASIDAPDVRAVLPAVAAPPAGAGAPAPTAMAIETSYKDSLREAERAIVRRALERHRWHVTRAAQALGLERSHLHRKMKALGIDPPAD